MKFLASLLNPQQAEEERRAEIYKSLIHWEAQVGGQLFGEVSKGGRREFFRLDRNVWVWHEEWTDNSGRHAMTTRYDVRPGGVVKSQGANNYQSLTDEEFRNFYSAVSMYFDRVAPELQRMSQLGR
jgi:hypothetical protein